MKAEKIRSYFLSEKENAVHKNNIGKYSEFNIINTKKHVLSEIGSLSLVYPYVLKEAVGKCH